MSEAVPPFLHVSSGCAQGQLYLCLHENELCIAVMRNSRYSLWNTRKHHFIMYIFCNL